MGFNGARDCGALIHLMVFLCCRVHRSLGSRSNFRSASPAIVSRRSSTFCRPNTTGIPPPLVSTNLSSPIAAKRRRTDFIPIRIKGHGPICHICFRQSWQFVDINRATANIRLRCLSSAISDIYTIFFLLS